MKTIGVSRDMIWQFIVFLQQELLGQQLRGLLGCDEGGWWGGGEGEEKGEGGGEVAFSLTLSLVLIMRCVADANVPVRDCASLEGALPVFHPATVAGLPPGKMREERRAKR